MMEFDCESNTYRRVKKEPNDKYANLDNYSDEENNELSSNDTAKFEDYELSDKKLIYEQQLNVSLWTPHLSNNEIKIELESEDVKPNVISLSSKLSKFKNQKNPKFMKNEINFDIDETTKEKRCSKSGQLERNLESKLDKLEQNVNKNISVKIHECNICHKVFGNKYRLNRHVSSVHDHSKPHKCNKCQKSFVKNYMLKRHVDSVHNQIKLFKCDLCPKTFGEKGNLIKHIDTMHKNIRCRYDKCPKSFTTKNELEHHIDVIHDNNDLYKCDICEIVFKNSCSLEKHIDVVHYNMKSYRCDMCQKGFAIKGNLIAHITVVHNNIKLHKCNSCDKTFGYKSHLKAHTSAVHKNIKPYKCDTCQKAFQKTSHLKRHVDNVHNQSRVMGKKN